MNVVGIVQARMGSMRLPGKVMLDLAGFPMLARVIHRLQRAARVNKLVIATTCEKSDDTIQAYCNLHGWSCFRGDEQDVLDRYYRAAVAHQAEVVVRVTSDCPLIDPEVVDRVVKELLDRQPLVHYASNTLPPRTFPRGLDVEAIRMDALAKAWSEDKNMSWREHVTPYLYRNPQLFNLHGVFHAPDYSAMRWTVDTPEDFNFVRHIYETLDTDRFVWTEVLGLLERHPELTEINRQVVQKVV